MEESARTLDTRCVRCRKNCLMSRTHTPQYKTVYEYSAADRKYFTNCPSGFRALLGTISRGNQSPRDFTVLFVWYLATVGLPGKGFGHNGTHRDSLLVPGKVSSHDETRRDLLCRLRTTESTGSSHDRTKRETLRGIPLPRYYTGFVCKAS